MTPITDQEEQVIERLITEATDAAEQMAQILGTDDECVTAMRNARDFLRGMRDAGQWCAFALPPGHHLAGAANGEGAAVSGLTLPQLLEAVEIVDAHIDANTGPDYQAQPLARTWARVTKVCEEAGEVWRALSKLTGENPRKGVCGTEDELLGELGDTVSAALCAIQHRTKDTAATWAVVSAALTKAWLRVDEHTAPAGERR